MKIRTVKISVSSSSVSVARVTSRKYKHSDGIFPIRICKMCHSHTKTTEKEQQNKFTSSVPQTQKKPRGNKHTETTTSRLRTMKTQVFTCPYYIITSNDMNNDKQTACCEASSLASFRSDREPEGLLVMGAKGDLAEAPPTPTTAASTKISRRSSAATSSVSRFPPLEIVVTTTITSTQEEPSASASLHSTPYRLVVLDDFRHDGTAEGTAAEEPDHADDDVASWYTSSLSSSGSPSVTDDCRHENESISSASSHCRDHGHIIEADVVHGQQHTLNNNSNKSSRSIVDPSEQRVDAADCWDDVFAQAYASFGSMVS